MKNFSKISIIILVFLSIINDSLIASESDRFIKGTNSLQDSIILVKIKTGKKITTRKEYTLRKGQEIKIWFTDREKTTTGTFLGFKNDSLLIQANGTEIRIVYYKINAIKQIPPPSKKMFGEILMVIGGAAMGFGGLLLVLMIAIGYFIYGLLALLILGVPGLILLISGKNLAGKKFRLDKIWKFKKYLKIP